MKNKGSIIAIIAATVLFAVSATAVHPADRRGAFTAAMAIVLVVTLKDKI